MVMDLPSSIGMNQVSALVWTRLAAPIPSMLSSLNQIGFDWITFDLLKVNKPLVYSLSMLKTLRENARQFSFGNLE